MQADAMPELEDPPDESLSKGGKRVVKIGAQQDEVIRAHPDFRLDSRHSRRTVEGHVDVVPQDEMGNKRIGVPELHVPIAPFAQCQQQCGIGCR